jgi:hypothetical protein
MNPTGSGIGAKEHSMHIVMQGVIHGKTIELEQSPGIDDGLVVQVQLDVDQPSRSPGSPAPEEYITAAGMMADYNEDDDAVLAEIYRGRKQDLRPEIEL